jgi:hypothetical protein
MPAILHHAKPRYEHQRHDAGKRHKARDELQRMSAHPHDQYVQHASTSQRILQRFQETHLVTNSRLGRKFPKVTQKIALQRNKMT